MPTTGATVNKGGQAQNVQRADDDGPIAKETTTAAFATDVITASAKLPILVDFHSPRSEPSRRFSVLLAKVVKASAGKVKLVRMDVDAHPQIASRLGVQSIPAVFAFQRGQPIDGFLGALPESQIKGFIERLVGPIEDGTTAALEEAEAALSAGDFDTAIALYEAVLDQDDQHVAAMVGLVRALVAAGDLEAARAISARISVANDRDLGVIAARAALELAEQAGTVGDFSDLTRRIEADPDDHQTRFDLAIALNGLGKREEAAEALLTIVKRDRTWNDDGARKQLLQFFEAWSLMDPVTLAARRRLSTLLFS